MTTQTIVKNPTTELIGADRLIRSEEHKPKRKFTPRATQNQLEYERFTKTLGVEVVK